MKQNQRIEKIDKFFKRVFKDEIKENNITLTDNTSLINDLGLNSLKLMETCLETEVKLDLRFKNYEIIRCKTYGDLKTLVLSKMEEKGL